MTTTQTAKPEPTGVDDLDVADLEIDLTDPVALEELLDSEHARRFSEEHIVEWLRTSGGTLTERIMKTMAADLIDGRSSPDT